MFVVWGVVLVIAGVALAGYARRQMRTRPGWDRRYGPGALLLLVGSFVALGGVVDIALGVTS